MEADSFRSSVSKTVHQTRINAAITELKLPAMSPTMTEGSIGEYKIKEGEAFSAGDVIMTVETDKGESQTSASFSAQQADDTLQQLLSTSRLQTMVSWQRLV